MLTRFKIAVFAWIMHHTPGLRRHQALFDAEHAQRLRLIDQLAEMTEELHEVRSERDALFRGLALLLDERLARAGA